MDTWQLDYAETLAASAIAELLLSDTYDSPAPGVFDETFSAASLAELSLYIHLLSQRFAGGYICANCRAPFRHCCKIDQLRINKCLFRASRNTMLDALANTQYLGLFVGDPAGAGTECSGTGYARIAVTMGAASGGIRQN